MRYLEAIQLLINMSDIKHENIYLLFSLDYLYNPCNVFNVNRINDIS